MQLKIKSRVDAEGNLHLQVPKNLADQELEVIVMYEASDLKTDTPTQKN